MRVPLLYRDAGGALLGELFTDGRSLSAIIDGVVFAGRDLDSLEPAVPTTRFALASGSLCACQLAFALPITVSAADGEHAAELHVTLELGEARASGGIDREQLQLELVLGDRRVQTSGRTGWFEDELAELAAACPDLRLKICFGCGLSDYSPYGHGLFGNLLCFRTAKAAYRAVDSKDALFEILDDFTEQVQETHVCAEFEPRRPGAGYRG